MIKEAGIKLMIAVFSQGAETASFEQAHVITLPEPGVSVVAENPKFQPYITQCQESSTKLGGYKKDCTPGVLKYGYSIETQNVDGTTAKMCVTNIKLRESSPLSASTANHCFDLETDKTSGQLVMPDGSLGMNYLIFDGLTPEDMKSKLDELYARSPSAE